MEIYNNNNKKQLAKKACLPCGKKKKKTVFGGLAAAEAAARAPSPTIIIEHTASTKKGTAEARLQQPTKYTLYDLTDIIIDSIHIIIYLVDMIIMDIIMQLR